MKQLAILLISLATPLASGCVSMGPNYDPAAVATLTPGMDRAAVIGRLGRPSTSLTLADGTQHLVWTHSRGSITGARARSVTLVFDAQGRFVRTQSEVESNIR